MTLSRFKAPFAPRSTMIERGDKSGSAFQAASIAFAHLLAVAAMVVIAGLVLYTR